MNGASLPLENEGGLVIVGNPENRRVLDFQAAAKSLGPFPPLCVAWEDLLKKREESLDLLRRAACIRIDSPGENPVVQQTLISLGGGEGELAFGEIGFLKQQYEGFCKVLNELPAEGISYQNSPADIKVMFDKWASHLRLQQAGLKRPRTALCPLEIEEFLEFRTSFCSPRSGRIFLKPRFGSSASGVCAYRWSGDRQQLIAPIKIKREGETVRLFNSLQVQSYTSLSEIHAILKKLLPQKMICEEWIRKAQTPEGQFDLRVLVIDRQARHVVVRQSHHPMTNLHLGNRRGDLNEVRELFGNAPVEDSLRLAEQAAGCFSDSLYGGVDILLSARGRPLVCEINAFGDLLPNLVDRGETPYQAILKATYGCGCSV